jgi:hypothetical protein
VPERTQQVFLEGVSPRCQPTFHYCFLEKLFFLFKNFI